MQEQLTVIRDWLGQGSINIFGMPFAGKDTQGGTLADLLDAELLGGGTILRNSIIPKHVKEIMDAGNLIPTDDYLRIVLPYLSQTRFDGHPLVLSSVGRWDGEQEGVMQATTASRHPIMAAVLLTVTEDVARARHATTKEAGDRGNRTDDAEDVFGTRLQEYQLKTVPVVEFYRQSDLLIEIDGTVDPPEVTSNILAALYQKASN